MVTSNTFFIYKWDILTQNSASLLFGQFHDMPFDVKVFTLVPKIDFSHWPWSIGCALSFVYWTRLFIWKNQGNPPWCPGIFFFPLLTFQMRVGEPSTNFWIGPFGSYCNSVDSKGDFVHKDLLGIFSINFVFGKIWYICKHQRHCCLEHYKSNGPSNPTYLPCMIMRWNHLQRGTSP